MVNYGRIYEDLTTWAILGLFTLLTITLIFHPIEKAGYERYSSV